MANARQQRAQLRETRAVYLRVVLRMNYDQIAAAVFPCPEHSSIGGLDTCPACERMYANRGGAYKAVTRALERDYAGGAAHRDRLKREQLATIDQVLKRLLQDALGKGTPADRARASTALARLLERQARLEGLDAPTRVTVTDELDELIREALVDLESTPLPDPAQLRES